MVERAALSEEMYDAMVEGFKSKGLLWTVKPNEPSNNASVHVGGLMVKSESGEIGYAEPVWEGDDLEEFGQAWMIHNADGIVVGSCSSHSQAPVIKCVNMYLHETISSSTPKASSSSPVPYFHLDESYPIEFYFLSIPFEIEPFEIKPSPLPSSRMPNSKMPDLRLSMSQMPNSKLPDSLIPYSSLTDSRMPSSRMLSTRMPPSRISSSHFELWP
jgi:hypothetical protein